MDTVAKYYNKWLPVAGSDNESALRNYAMARLALAASIENAVLYAVYWKNTTSPIADYFFVIDGESVGFVLEDSFTNWPKIVAKQVKLLGEELTWKTPDTQSNIQHI